MDDRYSIKIEVATEYIESQSDPDEHRYAFAYTITIINIGSVSAKLISRHWIITDADGHVEEVRGPGVVGEQPVLKPGEGFQYTSGCPLATPVGTMKGSYQCMTEAGTPFEVPIPEFVLSMPRILH